MLSETFLNKIPIPRRMNIEGVGVDLSEVSLRFVKLVSKKGKFELRDYGEYPIPEGTISLGQIQKPDVLKDILFRMKKEHGVKFVHASLPESLAYLADMDIVTVKKSELYESIELQLEEHIPLAAADAVFDYNIVETSKEKQGTITAIVTAVPKSVVASYVDIFSSAGITLLSLETDSSALSRAVIPKGSLETSMLLDLGRIKTGVYVVSHGFVFFVSDIDIGEKDIIAALMKELNLDAEGAKEMMVKLHSSEEPTAEVFNVVSSVFNDIKEEVNKHFIFWYSHRDKNDAKRDPIGKIILCGSGSTLYGLQDYLLSSLRTPIAVANVWENVYSFEEEIPRISFQNSLLYSTAIGLSLYGKKF